MNSIDQSTRPFLLGCGVFLAIMLTIGWFSPKASRDAFDFRQFYAAGVMLRTHPTALYNLRTQQQVQDANVSPLPLPLPYVHPSYEALLYAPFSLLPYRTSYLSFIVFNVLLLAATFFGARKLFNEIPGLQPRPGLLFFLFVPLISAVWQGQDSILFLLLCCCAWTQLEHGRDVFAGCIVAFCLFRFQLALPLAMLIVLRRGWRFAAGFLPTAALLIALSVGITGMSGALDMVHLLAGVSLSSDQSSAAQLTMAMHPLAMPNLFGLLYALGTRLLQPHAAFAVQTTCSLALFLWCGWKMRSTRDTKAAVALALVTSVLVSQHLYAHDATLLLLAFALLAELVPTPLLAICYYMPIALVFFAGASGFFLLAIPLLALLFYAAKTDTPVDALAPAAP